MNKPVPWNVKGVGFDAREAARLAARQAGVPLGEWLNSVISERAAELGVRTDDIDPDERLEAIAARLSDVGTAPAKSALPQTILSGAGAPMPQGRGQGSPLPDRDQGRRDLPQKTNATARRETFPKSALARETRPETVTGSTRAPALAEAWASDLADEDDDRGRVAAEAPVKTQAATMAYAPRTTRGSQPADARHSRDVAERARRSPARESDREEMGAVLERSRGGAPAATTGAQDARLDSRLSTILDKLNRSFEEAERFGASAAATDRGPRNRLPPTTPNSKASRIFDDAIAAIERRQSTLDTLSSTRSAVYDRRRDSTDRFADRPLPSTPEAPAAPAASEPGSAAAFAELHAAFKSLAEKLDARLTNTPPAREAAAPPAQSAEYKSLQSDIARLAQRIDRLHNEAAGAETSHRRDASVDLLRQEIAQLAGGLAALAPQRSLDSLEDAVRELVGRVDLSKLDGVQASVLEPVERLSIELRDAIRAVDPSQTMEALRRDIKALAATVEAMQRQTVDPAIVARVQDETHEMREMLIATSERFEVTEGLTRELIKLGQRVDQLAERSTPAVSRDLAVGVNEIRILLHRFVSDDVLGNIDRKIDALAARVDSKRDADAHGDMFEDLARQIDHAHDSLAARLSAREIEPVDLGPLEERIGVLSAKLDGFGRSSHDVNALYGLVGGLVDRIEEARNPQAEGEILNALQTQIGLLVERLDKSEHSQATLAGLEQSIGDLFLQIEQSRTIAIDAAENAARTAARDTLRAAMDNPSLNGTELTVQTGIDVDHVSSELAELRRAQETSERRVNATLNALNTTLERLVDRMVEERSSPQTNAAASETDALLPSDDGFSASASTKRRAKRGLSEALRSSQADRAAPAAFDPETFLLEPGSSPKPARLRLPADPAGAKAPAVEVERQESGSPAADVAPLIAAARRAAKAAQASARDATLKTNDPVDRPIDPATSSKTRSFFAQKRRPLLLGLAGLVLLLGTLQIAKISWTSGSPSIDPVANDTPALPPAAEKPITPPAAASPNRSEAPEPRPATPAASLLAPPSGNSSVSTSFNTQAPTTDNAQSSSLATAVADPALSGLSQGLRDLAASGNAAAQFEIAVRFSDGRTVARDAKLAMAWFQRAAQQGLAPAQYRLGSLYEKGIGVTADPALAVAWYERAAAQGNVRAMHNLAVMSAEGGGAKPDYVKAVSWFVKAANYGVRDSQFNLAVLYARGLGTSQSLTQSYSWFAIAAAQGDNDASQKRDAVAAKLDAKSLADAKAAVDSFKPLVPMPAANDVPPPPGGWDAVAPAKTAFGTSRKDGARLSSM